jgi:hypothetical protein
MRLGVKPMQYYCRPVERKIWFLHGARIRPGMDERKPEGIGEKGAANRLHPFFCGEIRRR